MGAGGLVMIKEMKVKFKSKPVFYEKEKSGIKNNTVRVVDDNYFPMITCKYLIKD